MRDGSTNRKPGAGQPEGPKGLASFSQVSEIVCHAFANVETQLSFPESVVDMTTGGEGHFPLRARPPPFGAREAVAHVFRLATYLYPCQSFGCCR